MQYTQRLVASIIIAFIFTDEPLIPFGLMRELATISKVKVKQFPSENRFDKSTILQCALGRHIRTHCKLSLHNHSNHILHVHVLSCKNRTRSIKLGSIQKCVPTKITHYILYLH